MRKYVQLLVVVVAFAMAVFLRHRLYPEAGSTRVLIAADLEPPATPTATPAATASPAAGPQATPVGIATPASTVAPAASPANGSASATAVAQPTATATASPSPTPAATVPPDAAATPTVIRLVPTTITGAPRYADGEYVGKKIYTNYGVMQFRVVIKDHAIEDIIPLSTLRATPTSIGITEEWMPKWIPQALATQSWDIERVSGATITWQAFQRALIYALRLAE